MKTRIIVDSTLDMTESFCRRARVIPLTIHFGQEVLTDGVTITRSQFYERLVSVEAMPTTSQPSPAAFEEAYEEIARAGESAVVITISSKLSGTCQSAQIAAEGYDNIYVVDSQNAANGAGILAEYAILCAEKGMAAPELAAHLKEKRNEICVIGVLDTLEYLKKGGRITPAAAALGTMLRLKPVLQIHGEKLDAFAKVRTMNAAKRTMIDAIRSDLENRFAGQEMRLDVAHTNNKEAALEFVKELEAEFPGYQVQRVDELSLSVACHIGDGCLAVACSRVVEV